MSLRVRERVDAANRELAACAQEAIARVKSALRAEQVAESNKIEGYDWTTTTVEDVVGRSEGLLAGPTRQFLEAVKADPRAYEALGLYQAHIIAERWASEDFRPSEVEIRQLHHLIAAGETFAGEYRTAVGTAIEDQRHKPPHPMLVRIQMREFCEWWQRACPYPLLTATVAHAWLTHIHPFEDGNGRLARLLANLALVQAGHPPLIVRSGSERARYYDALAASDDGDILPLFELFSTMEERTAARFTKPSNIRKIIDRTFLATPTDRYVRWSELLGRFEAELRGALYDLGWSLDLQGVLGEEEFGLLAELDPAGNAWFAKLWRQPADDLPSWLLWFGFCSDFTAEGYGRYTGYPSLFVSPRDEPGAVYPFRPRIYPLDEPLEVPHEITLIPGANERVLVRTAYAVDRLSVSDAAALLASKVGRWWD